MIHKISERVKSELLKKSAYSLPDKPSEYGINASEIKKTFYSPLIDDTNSVVTEIDRVVEEANYEMEVLAGYDNMALMEINNLSGVVNGGLTRIGALENKTKKSTTFYIDSDCWIESDIYKPFYFIASPVVIDTNVESVELINNNPIDFSEYGFSIIDSNGLRVLATKKPNKRINIMLEYIGDSLVVANLELL